MLTPLIFCLALCQDPPAVSDVRIPALLKHALEINSIHPDDDENFSDLMPLKDMIGQSRLVVLGEQSHGDGAVFLAKVRMVKFLHREMGFDVLAWESGMFDCREVDRALRDPAVPMDDVARRGIFPIWTASAQVTPVLDYCRASFGTERPLETAGFDHQLSAGSDSRWPQATIEFFDAADPRLLPGDLRASLAAGLSFAADQDVEKMRSAKSSWEKLPALMDEHRAALVEKHGEREFSFMRRAADDAVISLKSMIQYLDPQAPRQATDNNLRDQRMGENLIWLVNEHYKDRKIIAWMATFHAAHDIQQIRPIGNPTMYNGVVNCGTVAHASLGEAMYTIGFTAAEGSAGNVWGRSTSTLPPPSRGSLEDICRQTEIPFLLVELRALPEDHFLREPLISRPLGYGEMSATWPAQMDAMFYIRTMFPSTREPMIPEGAAIRAAD